VRYIGEILKKKPKKIKIGEGGQNYTGLIQPIEGSECARVFRNNMWDDEGEDYRKTIQP